MTLEKVSVVIPVFNSERFLKDSLESVLNQTYSDIEIICIDDGSTDNSLEILNEFSAKIKIIHQTNNGLASALNRGLEQMSGRWFKWFSPDDILNFDAIEILVKKGLELGDGCIVYSNWDMIDEKGQFLRSFSESNYNHLSNFEYNIRLLDGQQINVNTCIIPAKLFSDGLKIRNLQDPVAIDYDLFLQAGILHKAKFHLIENSLVKYRIHSEQLSHQKITKSLSFLDKIKSETLSKLDNETRKKYEASILEYQKNKPLSKKSLEIGLKLFSNILPNSATDKLLVFYLNKIRRKR